MRWIAPALVIALASFALAQDVEVPASNSPDLEEAPRRPGPGNVDEKARILFEAITPIGIRRSSTMADQRWFRF